jgi:acyl-CoA synthetase (NDP forming)
MNINLFPPKFCNNCMMQFDLMDKFFNPKSIALIGASRKPFGAANTIMTAILHKKYPGNVFLVNASAKEGETLFNLPLYKQIPRKVDLVFIIVPSRAVRSVIEDCIAYQITNIIIISSGFKESILYDQKKVELEKEIVELARANGLRLIGPNCNGIVNVPASFYALFGPRLKVPAGPLSVVSRGGTASGFILMGSSVFGRGLGINKLVNLGDACDVGIADLLTYYNEDTQTKVIGVYSEGIQDAPELLNIIRGIKKPIIFYKSGQSESGQRAALSHVGALASESTNSIYQGFIAQSGAIPANSIEELLDIAAAFSHSILPSGNKIGIFTFGGSLGVKWKH